MAEGGMGDLNTTVLDGRRLTFSELAAACNTLPFLTDRRLVVVENLFQRADLTRARGKKASGSGDDGEDEGAVAEGDFMARLLELIPRMPPSTRLLFAESKTLSRNHPIVRLAEKMPDAHVREFSVPQPGDLQNWVRRRAKEKGADIDPRAATLLATSVGQDLRALDQELEKLAAFVGYEGSIAEDDVRAMVSATREQDIFGLVDSLGLRQRAEAMGHLQTALADGANALYLLTMIARQVRLIMAAKELADEGARPQDIGQQMGIRHRFIIDKLLRQALQFEMAELDAIQRRVLEIDQAIKTGRVEGTLALEMLVLEICRRSRPAGVAPHQGSSRSRTR
jgi:DNA polymerase-3 subunit delta